jgi:hypothetical protein
MKTKPYTTSLGAAVADAYSELETLGEECREVSENMPESTQSSARYTALSDSGDTLVGLEAPDVPESLSDIKITFQQYQPASRTRPLGRGLRRDNAVMALQAAVDALKSREADEDADGLSTLLDDAIQEAQGCEFPGMFG